MSLSEKSTVKPLKARVLVVGAGPSGLVAALTLAVNGIPVRIIEKSLTSKIGQRGAGITPRSMELFEHLGVVDEIDRRAMPLTTVRLYKLPEGKEVLRDFDMIPRLVPTPDKPYPNYVGLSQFTIRGILAARLQELGIIIEWGVALSSLVDQGESGVQATYTNNKGEVENTTFEYVIGADGAKGVVRKLLGLPFVGRTNIENFIIGDILIEDLAMERWHQWGSAGDVIALRATEDPGVFNLVMGGAKMANMERSSEILASVDNLKAYLKERTNQDLNVKKMICIGPYIINIRMTETLGRGRIWLAGDSAHIHSPFGGQGMNVGLQDSFNLGWKLSLILKGHSPTSLLESYTEERIPVVAELLNLTTYFFKRVVNESTAEDSGWRRTEAVRQFGVNCRSSSIIIDEGVQEAQDPGSAYNPHLSGLIYAGDRAPDAPGLRPLESSGEKTRLFKIFDATRHTAMIFANGVGKELPEAWATFQGYPKELVRPIVVASRSSVSKEAIENFKQYEVFEDYEGYAQKFYLDGEYDHATPIIIIRPDGTIGARLRKIGSVATYFGRVFSVQV
ncbi:FAD binding domain-containing protein [Crepidotus variabilis]|uniref:FAD binding domain-containing protein n=1 Tax=Crepidotus variabilis TaxID=179855 RepID=A0A9P6E5W4_9AGAR|nr:FAD binding domain-containing protein [Crepidotus variabilis]